MASNYTSSYKLNQWAASDRVLRTEFNADNAKIDAALSTLDSGKADASALNSLQTTVNGLKTSKADKSALEALKTTVNQQGTALTGKGNCKIHTASYTGTGVYGKDNQTSLAFPAVPEIVFITSSDGYQATFIRGATLTHSSNGGTGNPLAVTWTGKSMKWYNHMSHIAQLNMAGTQYFVVALLKAD